MCLGVPGRVVQWIDRDDINSRATIEFAGVQRECSMACMPDAQLGEFVVVHAGIAICKIDSVAAEKTLNDLKTLGFEDELNELQSDPFSNEKESLQ